MQQPLQALLADIAVHTGLRVDSARCEPLRGGDISTAFRLSLVSGSRLFLKIGSETFVDAYRAEQAGLETLARVEQIRIPRPLGCGVHAGHAWLLLEYLEMRPGEPRAAAALGRALARMHRICAENYGWRRNNYIGATLQNNRWNDNWAVFYCEQRLCAQLELAAGNSLPERIQAKAEVLLEHAADKLSEHEPAASLLHGDLWGGNWAQLADGTPVLFDPAVYFGDRETDLAMTRLFGGFDASFYAAYDDEWPLAHGHETRLELYQLYHVLNHFNLFGPGYLQQAERMIDRLLSD